MRYTRLIAYSVATPAISTWMGERRVPIRQMHHA